MRVMLNFLLLSLINSANKLQLILSFIIKLQHTKESMLCFITYTRLHCKMLIHTDQVELLENTFFFLYCLETSIENKTSISHLSMNRFRRKSKAGLFFED